MKKLMKWVRTDGSLHLEVLVDGVWKHYKNSPLVKADAAISSNSGFATAQNCLRNGYKYMKVIEVVDFLEYKTTGELVEEIRNSIVQSQPVELNLEGMDSSLMDGLYDMIEQLRSVIELETLRNSISFCGGLELYQRVLQNYLVSENVT